MGYPVLIGIVRTAIAQAQIIIVANGDAGDIAQAKRDLPLTLQTVESALSRAQRAAPVIDAQPVADPYERIRDLLDKMKRGDLSDFSDATIKLADEVAQKLAAAQPVEVQPVMQNKAEFASRVVGLATILGATDANDLEAWLKAERDLRRYAEAGYAVSTGQRVGLTEAEIEAARIEVFKTCGADLNPDVAILFARALEDIQLLCGIQPTGEKGGA